MDKFKLIAYKSCIVLESYTQMFASSCYFNISVVALVLHVCCWFLAQNFRYMYDINAGTVFPVLRLYLSRELHHQSE